MIENAKSSNGNSGNPTPDSEITMAALSEKIVCLEEKIEKVKKEECISDFKKIIHDQKVYLHASIFSHMYSSEIYTISQ